MITVKAFDEEKTLELWALDPRCSVPAQTIYHRICDLGWSNEDAITLKYGKSPKRVRGEYIKLKTSSNDKVVEIKLQTGREWLQQYEANGCQTDWMNRDKRGCTV